MRVIVTGARAPVALHWCRLLKTAGHRVVLADCQTFPISRPTRFKDRYVALPRPIGNREGYRLAWERLLDAEQPGLILPTCEEVFYLAALGQRIGRPFPLFAPPFELLAAVHDKHRFARLAATLDAPCRPPETWLVRNHADAAPLSGFCGDLVLKPVWSRFGDRVIRRPDRDRFARMDWETGGPWVAQRHLPGEELSAYALAREGRVLALQAYRGLFRASGGASVAFAPCHEPDIDRFVAAFAARTGWTGQVSFDFRRDAEGAIRVIECNPRAVSGLHFFGPGDGLVEALFDGSAASATIRQPQTVRLALATYGLADALGSGRLAEWRAAMRDCADLTQWPGDRGFASAQFLALGEIIWLAIRHRTGLKAAATADTEWNGEPL